MKRRGFTLVEVLLATVIAAMLAAVALSLTGSLIRTQRAWSAATAEDLGERPIANSSAKGQGLARAEGPSESAMLSILRRDLMHAQDVRSAPNRFEITGYSAFSPNTLDATHQPARVVYRIAQADTRYWLVREQRLIQRDGTLSEPWVEPLVRGVASFEVAIPVNKRTVATGSGNPRPQDEPLAGAVPEQVVVRIGWTFAKAPLDKVLDVRP